MYGGKIMSTITVIRHAPTEYNTNKIFMGVLDIPLTSTEDIDITRLKKIFSDNGCSLCYTSPLKRAYDTSAVLFDKNDIITDLRLIERDLGAWAGLSKREIKSKYQFAFNPSGTMDFYYTPENGEDYEKMIERVAAFLIEIYEKKSHFAIVSHNGVFRVMKSLINGVGLSEVFNKFEPHLEPQTFTIDEDIANKIRNNCFYTVDRTT
jgi:broad specificity phosphatase PhoE